MNPRATETRGSRAASRPGGALLLALVAVVASPSAAAAQESVPTFSGAEEIEISGRVQVQSLSSSCADAPLDEASPCTEVAPGLDVFARRIRMAFDVTVNDFLSGEIQPDFGEVDGVELKNAYGRLDFGPGANLKIGQFKKPFDGFHLTSSTQILTIERDLDIPGVPGPTALSTAELTTRNRLSSYDLGVMLSGELGRGIRYWAGAFNAQPPEANGDRNSEKQFVGRVAYDLEAGELPLSLAAAGSLTDLAFQGAEGERGGEYYGNLELWAELGDFEGGPHLQASYVLGENALETPGGEAPDPPSPDLELATMRTWQVIGSWKLPVEGTRYVEAVEPVFRVTGSEPNADVAEDEVYGFTPGLQVFFGGRNKIALNWDVVTFADDGTETVNSFKAQYQFHF